jgi:hypothetical protein
MSFYVDDVTSCLVIDFDLVNALMAADLSLTPLVSV